MKNDLKKLFEEEPTRSWEDRVFAKVDPILEERAASRPRLLDWLRRPAFGLGLTGAAAATFLIFFLSRSPEAGPETLAVADDPAMIRDADMLLELPLLREWPALEKMEKKREWKKKRG